MAAVVCLTSACVRDVEAVVDEEFLASRDVARRLDVYAAGLLYGFAVCFACMVEPAGAVSATAAIDDAPVGESEQKGMSFFLPICIVARRFGP